MLERRPPRIDEATISDECAAWLGAMIEGEGSAYVHYFTDARQPAASLQFSNTKVELISAALRIAQVGSVSSRARSSRLSRRRIFHWRVERWWETLLLARRLAPYSMKAATLAGEMERVDNAA